MYDNAVASTNAHVTDQKSDNPTTENRTLRSTKYTTVFNPPINPSRRNWPIASRVTSERR